MTEEQKKQVGAFRFGVIQWPCEPIGHGPWGTGGASTGEVFSEIRHPL